jgi:hypothetical protein
MATETTALSALHYEMVRALLDSGTCPKNPELARRLRLSSPQLEASLQRLADIHGVVLHPHVCEPWVIHPFSLTPTLNFVQASGRGWWAPCIWCAFGVAAVAGGDVGIHTRIAAETSPLVLRVRDGELEAPDDFVVHFAIPPSQAWQNVHQHCALVLPFRNAVDIAPWCDRHGHTPGEAVPLRQTALLARLWYGRHADRQWQKWTMAEAQDIFTRAGLVGPFWNLGVQAGRF